MARGLPGLADHPATFLGCQRAAVTRGRCVHVVDGDTYDVVLDLGFFHYALIPLRLLGANTPELNSGSPAQRALATVARDRAAALLLDRHVLVRSFKDRQSFDRYIAEVWVVDQTIDAAVLGIVDVLQVEGSDLAWLPVNTILIAEQLAVAGPR